MKLLTLILISTFALAAEPTAEDKLRAQKTFREAQLKASNDQIALGNAMMQARASQEAVTEELAKLGKTLGCDGPADPQTAECVAKPEPPAPKPQ